MIKSSTKCSVVIRCYNEEEHIGKLLSGILQQTVKDIEIIIVDSGSTDATLSIARQFPVRILSIEPGQFTFGRALNRGCAAAKGEYIVLASAHVYPLFDNWIEHLIEPFSDPKVALVYGRQQGNENSNFSERQILAKWFPRASVGRQDNPFCNNANAAIRRDVWAGLAYNEELTGLEDLDWGKRALASGHGISYAGGAAVVHIHRETASNIFNRYRREAIALKQIMPHQRFSLFDFARLSFVNIASDYFHAVKEKALLGNILAVPSFRLMQFWGTYRGFSQHGPVARQLRERFYYPRSRGERQLPEEDALPVGNEINYGKQAAKENVEQHN